MYRHTRTIGFVAASALIAAVAGQAQEPRAAHAGVRQAEQSMRHLEGRLENVARQLDRTRERLTGIGTALQATEAHLEHVETVVGVGVARHLERSDRAVRAPGSDHGLESSPPGPWIQGDPGDSLYQAGRTALNRGDYRVAARTFEQLRRRFPRSGYVPDSYYWEAFARNRLGTTDQLRTALDLLTAQAERYADAATARDGRLLATRIRGVLAQRGDAEAAEEIHGIAAPPAPPTPPSPAEPPAPGAQRVEEEDDIRLMALMALLQMDADRAIPVLRQVMERRDPGSEVLRRRAVFVLAQKRSDETADILLDAARNDPDAEVRQQAVFFLSQVRDDRAVDALADILETADEPEVQQAALFALSQHRSERAGTALRAYAQREDVPEEVRAQAIFMLGQHGSAENQAFLRDLYGRLESDEVKAQILHAVSQARGEENQVWLMDIARDTGEDIELRTQALFWAGQSGDVPVADLVEVYDSMEDPEFRHQVLFVLSQRREPAAVDKLMDIARNDPNEELRRQAIFWLSQSRDPRVAEFLLEIINR
ncbi:MAG: HEAT repeat domain-containing protein [Gemmatimonadales bacterium]|jgi:HEAT repeat protein/TolA-binding protein